jgi:deoxyribonuclease V
MDYRQLHDWDLTAEDAIDVQRRLAPDILVQPLAIEGVRLVAGADISFDSPRKSPESPVYAGIVTIALPEKAVVEQSGVRSVSPFPYIPGLLSFREIPPLLDAWSALKARPDALIADGHGTAHPRRFGIACHLGMVLDVPTVGAAKSLLVGAHGPVPDEVGAWTPLVHRGETVGAALRTRRGVTPIYVSAGYRIDLPSALALVMRCAGPTRVPETTRLAHAFVNTLRRGDARTPHSG